MRNGAVGRKVDAWVASCEKIAQLLVIDNIDGPVVFSDPFDEMCTVVRDEYWYMKYKTNARLTTFQGLNGHNANT